MSSSKLNGLAFAYSEKGKFYFRMGENNLRQFKYAEAMSFFGKSIEFSAKGICEFLGRSFRPEHDISDALLQLSKKYTRYNMLLSRAALISSQRVGASQTARKIIEYGNQRAKIPTKCIIKVEEVKSIMNDAKEVCDFVHQIETIEKFKKPFLGILNGLVDASDEKEKVCTSYPYSEFRIKDWKERFKQFSENGTNRYNIREITVSEIDNRYAIIINPFGEEFPEKDVTKQLAFGILRDYIADGGIMVNVAGFPFFYAWDVNEGKEVPLSNTTIVIPDKAILKEGKIEIRTFRRLLDLAGNPAWKEFGFILTSDTDQSKGVQQRDAYQKKEDIDKAGDLSNVGGSNKIHEFRALRKETKDFAPLLRTQRPDFGEVYPIGAIKYGYGYLVVCGMHTKESAEFERIAIALDNFCRWIANSLQ